MTIHKAWPLLVQTFNRWTADKAPRMAAALAYYSTFSIAPLLIIVIAIAGLVFGRDAARGEIVAQFAGTIGPTAAEALEKMVDNASNVSDGFFAVVVGSVLLLVGATGVFVELQDSLNSIWHVPPRSGGGIWEWFRERFLSFALILGTGFLLIVSLVMSAAVAAIGKFVTPTALPGGALLWEGINLCMSLFIFTLLFAMIFKLLPDVPVAWRDVWIGAAVTAFLFLVGKHLLGLYLGQSSLTSAYGAAGTLVLLLLWIYYSAMILLFGAEFTCVVSTGARGSASNATGNVEARRQMSAPVNRPVVSRT